MPCYDSGYAQEEQERTRRKLLATEAMLCGVITAIQEASVWSDVEVNFDERKCGVKWSTIDAWWKRHQEEDAERKKKEGDAELLRVQKSLAISKLTPEERKLLGLP